MINWSIELFEFDIRYEPRMTIKAQALANFLVVLANEEPVSREPSWNLFLDGASSAKGSGANIILEKEDQVLVVILVRFEFPVSNNQAEYEALIVGLLLAKDIEVKRLRICSDS